MEYSKRKRGSLFLSKSLAILLSLDTNTFNVATLPEYPLCRSVSVIFHINLTDSIFTN